jgi:hypothetical protein
MTNSKRILTFLSLGAIAAGAVYFGHTFAANAFGERVEIRILGEPVHGRLVRDAFGNPIGFEAFSEHAPSGAGVLALNGE